MSPHPDLAHEQAHLDRAYATWPPCASARTRRRRLTDSAAQEVDSAIAKAHLERRLRSLDPDVPGLSFGRLDDEDRRHWYVGRRHVEDDHGDPVVVDWRARGVDAVLPGHRGRPPRAAPAAPVPDDRHGARRPLRRGLRRPRQRARRPPRRHPRPAAGRARARPAPARCATSSPRSRPSRTWSSARRSTPAWSCRAGRAPGKTAVGLHRAAFLLYEHRELLDQRGRARGRARTRCSSATSPRCCRRWARRGRAPDHGRAARRRTAAGPGGRPAVRRRGSRATPGMAERAGRRGRVRPRRRRPRTSSVADAGGRCRSPATTSRAAIDEILGRGVPFATGRTALRTRLHRLALAAARDRRGDGAAPADGVRRRPARQHRLPGRARPDLADDQRRRARAKRVLTSRAALAAAADGLLDADEQRLLLRRRRRRKLDDEPWTVAELVAGRRGRGARRRARRDLRPHRRGRGAGPLGHGAAGAGPPLPERGR